MESDSRPKKLINKGENNCFINVVVQILWNSKEAREQIIKVLHSHLSEGRCITCEIANLFINMKYSDTDSFSTQSLRHTLANADLDQVDFVDHQMGCAIETCEKILDLLHKESLTPDNENCNNECISHKYFSFEYCEEFNCCGVFEIGDVQQAFLLRLYANELENAFLMLNNDACSFEDFLKIAIDDGMRSEVCKVCGNEKKVIKRWISAARIFLISIVWDPEDTHFSKFILKSLSRILRSRRVFVAEEKQDLIEKYYFRGMICYQYSHYCAFIYIEEEKSWYQVDDSYVKKMPNFTSIVTMMTSNKSIPVLLLYEIAPNNINPVSAPISKTDPLLKPPIVRKVLPKGRDDCCLIS